MNKEGRSINFKQAAYFFGKMEKVNLSQVH